MAAVGTYEPDLDALREVSTRLVVGVGEKRAGQSAHEVGLVLAADQGLTAGTFPGDHDGSRQTRPLRRTPARSPGR